MYLKKLELSGFKSFAEKTSFDFGRGMTAIVGPNGSGKSNISDAMRWVLGEQSLKSLRGKKSEDVIFTGSDKKTRSSMASVSLYFDNQDGRMPVDYQEVIISRKLFRNGESEYLINNNKVRLLDIVDLLTKSGVGQKGYCVINQGMADAILRATPAERMAIFEEATGVRPYQIKKEQSLNKLESTQQNLTRITDLLKEIEPRLNSLRRQANKAQKREKVEKELKILQKNLYGYLWQKLKSDEASSEIIKKEIEEKIFRAEKEMNEVKNKLSKNEENDKTNQGEYENFQKELEAAREKINFFQRNLSIADGRIEIEKEKMEKLKSPEETPINLAYVKEKISSFYNTFENLFDLILKSDKPNDLDNLRKKARETKKLLENILEEIKSGKIKMEVGKLENQKLEIGAAFNKLNLEKEKIEGELKKREEKYLKIKNKITELNLANRERRKSFFEMEKELREKQDKLNQLKNDYNSVRIDLAKFEVRREDLKAEITSELGSDPVPNFTTNNNGKETALGNSGHLSVNKQSHKIMNGAGIEETKSKIRKLKYQLEQIGGIDPLVMDEYQETKERFEFLSGQSRDLTEASESLRKIIKELDKKIEKIFNESFKNISREFSKYFKIVFGGGKASLKIKYTQNKKEGLEENNSEDIGSGDAINRVSTNTNIENKKIGGIEISAVPPGKKITNLSMLSGGERALVSLAVLFAIVANNPPPFSMLDEIDTALDEANSARLGKIVKELSDKTQFIMITHNRAIMENAEILYGITMQDDGVSKILSLKLEK